jgi:hypothetical protein
VSVSSRQVRHTGTSRPPSPASARNRAYGITPHPARARRVGLPGARLPGA